MIPPSQQWCLMIDITNACHLHCSNCTRLLDHARQRYFMTPECYEKAIISIKDFPYESEPAQEGRRNMIGMIGGEPLLHPQFPELAELFIKHVPDVHFRGLWTSLPWDKYVHPKYGPALPHVVRLIGDHRGLIGGTSDPAKKRGWLNWNMHLDQMNVYHQPLLVASKDVVPDEQERWELIENCWLQQKWSSTITPKGFFFCEVAGHMDMVFNGPGGFPLEPSVWKGDLYFERDENNIPRPKGKFAKQVKNACENCGACVPMQGRRDWDETDDVSQSNLDRLVQIDSPRIKRGDFVLHKTAPPSSTGWSPRVYVRGRKPENQTAESIKEGKR